MSADRLWVVCGHSCSVFLGTIGFFNLVLVVVGNAEVCRSDGLFIERRLVLLTGSYVFGKYFAAANYEVLETATAGPQMIGLRHYH